jgi:molybdenum-dependent DNA-binding transcriptional regulator ModE
MPIREIHARGGKVVKLSRPVAFSRAVTKYLNDNKNLAENSRKTVIKARVGGVDQSTTGSTNIVTQLVDLYRKYEICGYSCNKEAQIILYQLMEEVRKLTGRTVAKNEDNGAGGGKAQLAIDLPKACLGKALDIIFRVMEKKGYSSVQGVRVIKK